MHNTHEARRAISPVSSANDTGIVSQIIDLQGCSALEFLIATGSLGDADATFTTLVEHGDVANLSDAVAVPDSDLLGTEAQASFIFSDDDKVYSIGYKGIKRYVRLTITPANNGTAGLISAIALVKKMKVGSL